MNESNSHNNKTDLPQTVASGAAGIDETVKAGSTPAAPSLSSLPLAPSAIPVTPEAKDRYILVDAKTGKRTDSAERAQLARGGMGRILCAFDTHTGREVVIKERLVDDAGFVPTPPRPDTTSPDDARFVHEARITARLEHPHIVPVHEIGRKEDGSLYYTMRKVRGRTLAAALGECETLRERMEFLPHFLNLCHAIAYAHSKGVIHRDIKPHNVIVSDFGETVVLDWGLAKIVGSPEDDRDRDLRKDLADLKTAGDARTVAGYAIGTPSYMPPEQAEGDIPKMDPRSDVYSLGAVLYEILTGVPPFRNKSFFETIADVMTKQPVAIRRIERKIPKELAEIAHTALSKDRDQRYLNAGEMARRVQEYLSGRFVPPPTGGARAWIAWLWREKRRPILWTAAVLALIAAGLLAHQGTVKGLKGRIDGEETRTAQLKGVIAKEAGRFSQHEARILESLADRETGTAAGLATAAHIVLLDDTPGHRAKLYEEATARPYGMAEKGFFLGGGCVPARVPAGGEKLGTLPCVLAPHARWAGATGPAALRSPEPALYVISLGAAALPGSIPLPDEAHSVALSPEGGFALADRAGAVHVFDRFGKRTGSYPLPAGAGAVEALALFDTPVFAAGTTTGALFLWTMADKGKPRAASLAGGVRALAYSRTGELFALGGDGAIARFSGLGVKSAVGGKLCAGKAAIGAAALRELEAGGIAAAAACGGAIELGRVEGGALKKEGAYSLPEATSVTMMDLSFDASAIFLGTGEGLVGAIAAKGEPAGTVSLVAGHTGPVAGIAATAQGAVSTGADGAVKFWTAELLSKSWPHRVPPKAVDGEALDVDRQGYVLMRKGDLLTLEHIETGFVKMSRAVPSLRAARLTSNGGSVIAANGDGALTVLRAGEEGAPAQAWPSPVDAPSALWVLDRTGARFAAVSNPDGELGIVDYQKGVAVGAKRKWAEGPVAQVLINPDNVNIAVLYASGAVFSGLKDAASPSWEEKGLKIAAIALTQDGRLLVLAGEAGELWLVNLARHEVAARPCAAAGAKEPAAGADAPASCLAPTGMGAPLALAPLGAWTILVVRSGGMATYDLALGGPLVTVETGPGDFALIDPAGTGVLTALRKADGAQALSLWPAGGWLTDPPNSWTGKVARATGYEFSDGVLQPIPPGEWEDIETGSKAQPPGQK